MKTYLYVFDTLADWEIGYATAELNSGRYFEYKGTTMPVIPIATTTRKVKTMGGLELEPQFQIADVAFEAGDLLILPGGDAWFTMDQTQILDTVAQCLERNVWVAAICGATLGLAEKGLLDKRYHTSNDLNFLQTCCPRYAGSEFYLPGPAVADQNLITASGIAPLEFAYQIFKNTGLFRADALEAWYQLYKYQQPEYYYKLVASLER